MDLEREKRLNDLLLAAFETPPAERLGFLEEACAGDSDLLAEVLACLGDETGLGDFLEQPAAARTPKPQPTVVDRPRSGDTVTQGVAAKAGVEKRSRVGPFRILSILGEGGMGRVYLAEQTHPVRRRVALKVIASGFASADAYARFAAERQAMARLTHPNIGQMLEAGKTEDGHPFFAMELVAGDPITRYCDKKNLSVDRRLEIYLAVCSGVQHAHQKQIVHRDLKPSNVLVTEVDGRPVPKIIDFGVAKALDQPLTDASLSTGDRIVGTPAYMSPEALRIPSMASEDAAAETVVPDIDTRTDVYALGILLYELLTGTRPFEKRDASVTQVLRRIMEEDAPRPSSRLTTLAEETWTDIARRRQLEPPALRRRLSGDLDWIVMKAIAKDRQERYSSAAELGADVERHLRDEPVLAASPSRLYRARKFVRRHAAGVAASALVMVLLAGGFVARTLEARRANRESAAARRAQLEAEQVVGFLIDLFQVSDPGEARGNTVTVREILDRGAERIQDLGDQPLTQARLMDTIGTVYRELGLYDPAAELLENALAIREAGLPGDNLDVATSANRLAKLYWYQGRYDTADRLFEQALEIRERILGPQHLAVAETLADLADAYKTRGRIDEAERLYRRALETFETVYGKEDEDVAYVLQGLAILLLDDGRVVESRPLFERALAIREKVLSPDHPKVAHSANGLAMVCSRQGENERAEELFRRSLAIREKVLGPDHPDIAQSLNNLANVLLAEERFDEAEPLLRRAVDVWERTLGSDHFRFGIGLHNLADFFSDTGRPDEAEADYLRAADIFERALGPDHLNVSYPLKGLADLYRDLRRYDEAEDYYRRSLIIREAQLEPGHQLLVTTLRDYAAMLREIGREEDAEGVEKLAGPTE